MIMPIQALQYFYKGWFAGKLLCVLFAVFHNIIKNVEWMSVAMIALIKCVHLVSSTAGNVTFSKHIRKVVIPLIWMYAISMAMYLQFKVKTRIKNFSVQTLPVKQGWFLEQGYI